MFIRIVSIIVIFSQISMLFVSCRGDLRPEATDQKQSQTGKPDLDVIEARKAGKIHNEILRDFIEQHPLVESGKIEREQFIESFLPSVNMVLQESEIPTQLGRDDVVLMLAQFDSLRSHGVFDFYAHKDSDPDRLIDYLVEIGALDSDMAGQARALVEQLETIDFPGPWKEAAPPSLSSVSTMSNFSPEIVLAAQIADSSYAFWSELCKENQSIAAASGEPEISMVDWWTINLILWDALGAILGLALGGPVLSIILCALASIAFVLGTT